MTQHMTTTEAADYLASIGTPFKAGTLEVWRSLGRGPRFKKIASRVFYTQADLDDFARGQFFQTVDSQDQSGRCAHE